MTKSFTHLDATERRLVSLWKKRGLKIPYMAELLDRDEQTDASTLIEYFRGQRFTNSPGRARRGCRRTFFHVFSPSSSSSSSSSFSSSASSSPEPKHDDVTLQWRIRDRCVNVISWYSARTVPVQCPYSARTQSPCEDRLDTRRMRAHTKNLL